MAFSASSPKLPNKRDPCSDKPCTTDSPLTDSRLSLTTDAAEKQHQALNTPTVSKGVSLHSQPIPISINQLELQQQSHSDYEPIQQLGSISFALSPYEYRDTLRIIWPNTVPHVWENFDQFKKIYNAVKTTGLPNYISAKIPLSSGLNISQWRQQLTGYPDEYLVDFLEYGWPLDYTASLPPKPTYINHERNPQHQHHIEEFLETELKHSALLGPFHATPFTPWTQISPIMTRAKKSSKSRRIVIDLSFPEHRSVNAGIHKGWYQGAPFSFALPTIADLVKQVIKAGRGCYVWSADLARAYRQLRVCPLSVPLLGLKYNGKFYLDLAPSFGCRMSAMACARTTAAVSWLLAQQDLEVLRYLDDFAAAESTYDKASWSYSKFIELTSRLGLQLSHHKCVPPTTTLTWLGYTICTETLTLTLPSEKVKEAIDTCRDWLLKSSATRVELASLFGVLKHIATCVPPAKRFLARILCTLRNTPFEGSHKLPSYMDKDLNWFIKCAAALNGVVLLPPVSLEQWVIECDSSLTGGGAFSSTNYFAQKYSQSYLSQFKHIHQLEAMNLLHALKYLLPQNPNKYKIILNTDNAATQATLTEGIGRDLVLCACSRQLWLIAVQNNTDVEVVHKPGKDLVLADALSRSHDSHKHKTLANSICKLKGLQEISILHTESILDKDL